MAMVSQEGNSNTPCFLLPPFQGEIKPPAMRVVVDFRMQIGRAKRHFIEKRHMGQGELSLAPLKMTALAMPLFKNPVKKRIFRACAQRYAVSHDHISRQHAKMQHGIPYRIHDARINPPVCSRCHGGAYGYTQIIHGNCAPAPARLLLLPAVGKSAEAALFEPERHVPRAEHHNALSLQDVIAVDPENRGLLLLKKLQHPVVQAGYLGFGDNTGKEIVDALALGRCARRYDHGAGYRQQLCFPDFLFKHHGLPPLMNALQVNIKLCSQLRE
jgi:hypothetical protein